VVRAATCTPEKLGAALRKGDVLLVEGSSRFSTAVKYLTQSTWSHAALCIEDGGELLEADVVAGVRCSPLTAFAHQHTRICRPVGLRPDEIDALVEYGLARIGHQYDLKNVFDLGRYLVQPVFVPVRWRRRLLALGSGDPTQAICSSLVAQAFQSVNYPILPESVFAEIKDPGCVDCYTELLHIRHHSLFTPRDFDISPYFQIVKPTLASGFDPHALNLVSELPEDLHVSADP
jgi:hypothetical protein